MYEEAVENQTQATKRDGKVRNQQLKVTWESRCQKIDEIGILFGDKSWEHCEQEASSLPYLCIGTEGHRIFKGRPSFTTC